MSSFNDIYIHPDKLNNHGYRKSSKFIGTLLESATAIFQDYEVRESYNPENLKYIIETNKILSVEQGYSFEIDVWVKVILNERHSRVIAFECKNWKNKVGLPEINNFKTKVRDINGLVSESVTGIVVAKTFTKDAINACRNNQDNVSILVVDEVDMDVDIKMNIFKVLDTWTKVIMHTKDGRQIDLVSQFSNNMIEHNGAPIDFNTFLEENIDYQSVYSQFKKELSQNANFGIFTNHFTKELYNGSFHYMHEKVDISKTEVTVIVKAHFAESRLVSQFDFDKQKRITIQKIMMPDGRYIPFIYGADITKNSLL